MDDKALIGELNYLGIDEESYKVVALLPLVQVGWADGRIQAKERELILNTARTRGLLAGDGARILEGWLHHPPTHEYQQRGRKVLVELATRQGDLGHGLTSSTLDEVLVLCMDVAKAAGGVFGVFGRVEPTEKQAIAEIAETLEIERDLAAGRPLEWGDMTDLEG